MRASVSIFILMSIIYYTTAGLAAEKLNFPLKSSKFLYAIQASGGTFTKQDCVAIYKHPLSYTITKHLGHVQYHHKENGKIIHWKRLQHLTISDSQGLWRSIMREHFTYKGKKYNFKTNYVYYSSQNHNLQGIWWNSECQGFAIFLPKPISSTKPSN